MSDDPYFDLIDEQWANIVRMHQTFKHKDQIIEFDVLEEKIYSYLFVKDTPNQRLRSYILDLPE